MIKYSIYSHVLTLLLCIFLNYNCYVCCIHGNIYGIVCVICIYIYIYICLAMKCSLHLFCIAPIYVDVTNVFVVLSYRL